MIRRIGLASSNASGSSAQLLLQHALLRGTGRAAGWRPCVPVDAGEVVDAVVRDRQLDRGVGVLEAGLPLGCVRGEGGQRGQVAARGAAGDGDVVGVAAVGRDVLADPGDRLLDVDRVGREGVAGREPVVDRDADPALGGQVLHQRDALLVLGADRPAAAVHLEQHRRVLDRALGGQVDVEVVAAAGLAVGDVLLDPDRPPSSASGTGRPASATGSRARPGSAARRAGRGSRSPSASASAASARVLVGAGLVDQVAQPDRGGAGHRERDGVAALLGQVGGRVGRGDGEPVRRQLAGDPAGEERRDDRPGSPGAAGSRWRSGRRRRAIDGGTTRPQVTGGSRSTSRA